MATPIIRIIRESIRENDTVQIDARAEPTDDGRVHVSIAVIELLDQSISLRPGRSGDGPTFEERQRIFIGEEPWYDDVLDECSDADLARLADEALAAHS